MPRFTIIPQDPDLKAAEIIAPDGATALYIIAQAHCPSARVKCDGQPAFDARLNDYGVWSIFPAASFMARDLARKA